LGIKQMLTKDAFFALNMADSRRTPNLYERYYDGNTGTRSDVGTLTPETVNSKEMSLGWKGYSLSRFEDTISDLINYKSPNYSNISGDSKLSGWEWKASESLPSIASEVSLNYLVLDAKDATGITLARRPDTSGSINWTYLGLNKTVLALQTQFVGTRLDYVTTPTATQLNPDTGNYWLWHANASYQWNKEVRVFVKGINLTDEHIVQAYASKEISSGAYYAYSPRTVLAGVEYKF
jgi:outer membrane cobalamin receptor